MQNLCKHHANAMQTSRNVYRSQTLSLSICPFTSGHSSCDFGKKKYHMQKSSRIGLVLSINMTETVNPVIFCISFARLGLNTAQPRRHSSTLFDGRLQRRLPLRSMDVCCGPHDGCDSSFICVSYWCCL